MHRIGLCSDWDNESCCSEVERVQAFDLAALEDAALGLLRNDRARRRILVDGKALAVQQFVEFLPGMDIEFLVNAAGVNPHGALRKEELFGYLRRVLPLC